MKKYKLDNKSIYTMDWRQQQADSTEKYRQSRLNAGAIELTIPELKAKLAELGYEIQNSNSFSYYNNLNEIGYYAHSCYIVDIKTKVSFAHVDHYPANVERVEALQKFRLWHFGFDGKKIWDI